MPVAIIQERIIPLLAPVRVYTAKELAAMPLSQMNAAIEAQEKYVFLEQNTRMGVAAIEIRRLLEHGSQLVQVCEKSRTRYRIGDIYYPPRIVRQLEARGLVRLAVGQEGQADAND